MPSEADNQTTALEGRMPVLPDERIFASFGPFLWSCTTLGSAIWIFLVGAGLAALGDIRTTIPGYSIGLILGFLPPILSSGLPSFRYGVDVMDATKAVFGSRGTFIPLLGLLYVVCAWEAVVTAFIAKGGATLVANGTGGGFSHWLEIALAMLVIAATWAIVRQGPKLLEKVNNLVGPGLLLLAMLLLVLLARRVGVGSLWTGAAPATGRMSLDAHQTFISAVELGIGASFGNWPFMGGLLRLVRHRRHVVTPSMIGLTVIGLGFGSAVSAMIAVALPSDDPILWILNLGGPTLGTAIVVAILISNIAIIGLLSYFAAVSIQQIKLVERMPWGVIIALTLTSAFVAAFNVDSTLSAVVAIANYQGMVLVGISAVCSADYLILRGQRLEIAQLYVSGPAGRYWFWGGINWIAIIGVLTSGAIYLALYNPATLASSPAFRLFGASLPAYFGGGLVYILATLAIRRFTKAGGYVQSMPAKVAYVSL